MSVTRPAVEPKLFDNRTMEARSHGRWIQRAQSSQQSASQQYLWDGTHAAADLRAANCCWRSATGSTRLALEFLRTARVNHEKQSHHRISTNSRNGGLVCAAIIHSHKAAGLREQTSAGLQRDQDHNLAETPDCAINLRRLVLACRCRRARSSTSRALDLPRRRRYLQSTAACKQRRECCCRSLGEWSEPGTNTRGRLRSLAGAQGRRSNSDHVCSLVADGASV